MGYDIQCPNCGEFSDKKDAKKGCPRCGSKQAISLWHRDDIDSRFRMERDNPSKLVTMNGMSLKDY